MEKQLKLLCEDVRKEIKNCKLQEAKKIIAESMQEYPDSAVPHNLMGILLEVSGRHPQAMKHLRAAWALDPTFIPARCNMENFGSFHYKRTYVYTEEECPNEIKKTKYQIVLDENGVGHFEVRK